MNPRLYDDLVWIWPLLSPPEEYTIEAPLYVEQLRRLGVPERGTLLHMGCGGGSLDLHLKRHFAVTSIDLSAPMLAHASAVNPEVEYLPGDIRSARLDRTFDGVFVHDAIAYVTSFEGLVETYRTAAAHLAPGGALVSLPEQLTEYFEQDAVETFTLTRGDATVTTVELMHDPDPNDTTIETTYVFLARRGGKLEVEVDTHLNGMFPLEVFERAMREGGFDTEVVRVRLGEEEALAAYPLLVGRRRA